MNAARAILSAILATLVASVPTHAQDRTRTIRQYHHTTWTAKDGAPPEIWALDQGPDGFLWLGTGSGLYRFDGITFDRYQPERGQKLPSFDITAIRVLPSNEIWIGYSDGGVSHLKDGRVTTFTERDGIWPEMIHCILQDAEGALWALSKRGLARFVNGQWRRVGADWNIPEDLVTGLVMSRDGALWVSTTQSIYFARPGSHRFEPTGVAAEQATLTQTPDGRMWVADRPHGLRPLPNSVVGDSREPEWSLRTVDPAHVLLLASVTVDRQGVIWGTDRAHSGVVRFDPFQYQQPTHSLAASDVDVFRQADGLTPGRSIPILSDREGNIWVGTSAGLNRFRTSEIITDVAVPPAPAFGHSVAALADATYITEGSWLYRALPHQPARRLARLIAERNTLLFRSSDGALWYGNDDFMQRRRKDHLSRVTYPSEARGKEIHAIAEDGAGTLWVMFEGAGMYQLRTGAWTRVDGLGDLPSPTIGASDLEGAVWFGYAGAGSRDMTRWGCECSPSATDSTWATSKASPSSTGCCGSAENSASRDSMVNASAPWVLVW